VTIEARQIEKSTAAPGANKPGPPTTKSPQKPKLAALTEPAQITHEAKPADEDSIRHGAYLRWEAAGRPDGDGLCFWLDSEQELQR